MIRLHRILLLQTGYLRITIFTVPTAILLVDSHQIKIQTFLQSYII